MKTKIAISTFDYWPRFGGIGRNLFALTKSVNEVSDFPYEIKVYSPNINELSHHSTCFRRLSKLPGQHLTFSILFNIFQSQLLKHNNYSALILPGGPGGVFCVRPPSYPLIYIANHTYHQQISAIPSENWKKIFIPLEKKGYHLAQKIIAISTTTKSSLINHYAIDPRKIEVISPGLSMEIIHQRNQFPTTNDMLYVGRLDERKGIEFLIDTLPLLANYTKDFHLHIVGTGKLEQCLKAKVVAARLEGNVSFYGNIAQTELAVLYQKCIIQVVPSALEGFGIAALEAMSEGLAIIATSVPGLSDIIQDQDNGILVEYLNHQALCAAILELFNNPTKRANLTGSAYKKLEEFSWPKLLAKYKLVFDSVCKRS